MKKPVLTSIWGIVSALLLFSLVEAQENSFDRDAAEQIKKMEEALASGRLPRRQAEAYKQLIEKLKKGEGFLRFYKPEDRWNLVDIQYLPEGGKKATSKSGLNHVDDSLTEAFESNLSASEKKIQLRVQKTSTRPGKKAEVATSGYDIIITPPPPSMKPGGIYNLSARISSFSNGNTFAAFGPPRRSHPTVRLFGAAGSQIDPERSLTTLRQVEEDGKPSRKDRYGITREISKGPGKTVTEKSVRFAFPKMGPPQYLRVGVGVGSTSSVRVVYVYKYNGKPLPRLEIKALDANPQYFGDTLPSDLKTVQVVKAKNFREGTTADGVSQLILRAELPGPVAATFSLASPDDGTIVPMFSGKTLYHEDQYLAFALYTPPAVFTPDQKPPTATFHPDHAPKQRLDGILDFREVKVKMTIAGSPKTITQNLKLARPPLVLVHGLGSNPQDCWVTTKPAGTSMIALLEKAGFLPFTVNYQKTNGVMSGSKQSSFAENFRAVWDRADPFTPEEPTEGWMADGEGPILSEFERAAPNRIGGIRHALEHYRDKYSLAVTQADVVGHSMGGLLARCYSSEKYHPEYKRAANFHQGDINRIISVNTPHHGSELAHVYDAVTKAWVGGEEWGKWGKRMVPAALAWLGGAISPAMNDLRAPVTPDQIEDSALGKIQAHTGVPAYAIATTVDHNQLGSSEFDHYHKYRQLYGTIGLFFFYNRPLLDSFLTTRFDQWKAMPDDLRQGPVISSGVLISPDNPSTVENYLKTVHDSIDRNAVFWTKRREAKHQADMARQLEKTTIVPFGTVDNDRSKELKPEDFTTTEKVVGRLSDFFVGGNLVRFRNTDSDQDVPATALGLLRSLVFHHDPKNDGAVRVVSQLGGLPEESSVVFGEQDGGIMHSYSTWHYRVQREVIHVLNW